jgi:tRNA threonylcarbamoyladenosine biosynthesis protein TsaB
MLLLGIETSGQPGGIAVVRDGQCLYEAALGDAPRRHAQTLVSEIDAALERLKLSIGQFDAVAVSIGPGSFTGLRVGVVCAKTLAYATGCKLTAVDTLQAIAANSPPDIAAVHVIADAQRGDVYLGTYRRSPEEEWIREGPITIVAAKMWVAARSPEEAITGPGLATCHEVVSCQVLPPAWWLPTARTIAQIGARQIERGELADCASLEPFYLRASAAEEKKGSAP